MSDWLNRCHWGDCRELMAAWPDASVDACVTDPPYGDTSLEWDRRCDGWMAQVARVLKPAASVWVFGSMRYLATVFAEMEAHGFRYSQDVVWEKQNGTGFHADRFRRVHEHAVMFYRGAWADVYHRPQFTHDAVGKTVRRKTKPTHTRAIASGEASTYVSEDGGPKLATSVIFVPNEHGNAVHPTQKPLGILAPLLRYSVPPGGVVIDPFAGSLSTGIAAEMLGMQWAACELNPDCRRMQAERQRQPSLLREAA
ncbi:site-specific DNA-methyltransferase [Xenophilus aerolatus]